MCTFKGALQQLPWLLSHLNTLEPSHAPGGYIHRCYQTIFSGAQGTVLSQIRILQLSKTEAHVK